MSNPRKIANLIMFKVNRILLTGIIMVCCLNMTGCKKVQLFKDSTDPNKQVLLTDDELENDVYYVKNGTKFIEVYKPLGTAENAANILDRSRVFYCVDSVGDENLIPTHYMDEFVAYASEKSALENISLERFADFGYSIGVYGGYFGDDGYYHVDVSDEKNEAAGSSFKDVISKTKSTDIRIKAIDGVDLKSDYIDVFSGFILGMKQGQKYLVSFYSGTYYYEQEMIADTHMFRPFETYTYDTKNMEDTKNGYAAFMTPNTLKSGYYNINGAGLFKYYDFHKGEGNETDEGMNENYYASADDMIKANSSVYSFMLNDAASAINVTIKIPAMYEEGTVRAYVYSPDDTRYTMERDYEKNQMQVKIASAMSGKWQIYTMPQGLDMSNISVETEATESEKTLKEKDFTFDEVQKDKKFAIDYIVKGGKDDPVCSLINNDTGETFLLKKENDTKIVGGVEYNVMSYTMNYVPTGDYTLRVYYYPLDVELRDLYMEEAGATESDVITVTD